MAGDDLLCVIDQDRIAEAILLDAVCNLPDLAVRMRSGVIGVRSQVANKRIFDFHRNSSISLYPDVAPRGPVGPRVTPPGETLGQGIDLIVMAPGESQQLRGELSQGARRGRRTEPPANRSVCAMRRARLSVSGL
jgi:hypothetical protein